MINLIHFRKERLLDKKAFKNQNEINSHIQIIEKENRTSDKRSRMRELENWLNFIN